LNGLWIQGAEWDPELKMLVEPITTDVYQEFPTIKCTTEHKADLDKNSGYLDTTELHKLATD